MGAAARRPGCAVKRSLHRGGPGLGTFAAGLADGIGIDAGFIFTMGAILNAVGPDLTGGISVANALPGDVNLDALLPAMPAPVTADASVLTASFTIPNNPIRRVLSFQVVFASDEFIESVNDPFGFVAMS
ncbi:MAG: choice-of-anchor L domain-containing protein [Chromatiales bacterium]|nr:choice-of-anchor L domain-containing protein [Chromatiales bacterium]